jgi:hypothetical protein
MLNPVESFLTRCAARAAAILALAFWAAGSSRSTFVSIAPKLGNVAMTSHDGTSNATYAWLISSCA